VSDSNRDALINGVTNAGNASPGETFLYYNIIPKLQAYDLANNEKVPSARYRRGYLNRKGQIFFAGFEKKILLAKSKKTAVANQPSSDAAANQSSPDKAGQSAKRPEKSKPS
jgi:hypothetical protein